ncbi:MAG: enoyl-CoA hydratase/isomerase family protein [Spirochaetales bacterium]|jgi:enoyl-CoA hydratase|nr:enoyl-CoA hydratase/isomerase family protein [Spirochaetales bacterium]
MRTNITLTLKDRIAELLLSPDDEIYPPTIDYAFFTDLEGHLMTLEERRDDISVVFLRSLDPDYFAMGAHPDVVRKLTRETVTLWAERGFNVFSRLERLPVPVVAVVTGKALGGGLELALSCDYILASDAALFGHPESVFGFVPAWGSCQRLPERIGWPHAKELFYTGKTINAAEAFRLGLVNFYGTQEELDAHISSMADDLKYNSQLAVRLIKQITSAVMETKRLHGTFPETAATAACLETADTVRRFAAYVPENYRPYGR